MALLLLVATVALLASCQGAALPDVENLDTVMEIVQEFVKKPESLMEALGARAKRETSPSGFKVFPLAFIGAEVGIKYNSYLNPGEEDMRGGEAYLHIDDLQALIPRAKSKMVKLHAKFSSNVDLEWTDVDSTLLNFEVDYKLEHKSGHGIEAGSFKVARKHTEDSKFVDGVWKFLVKSETVPFVPLPLLTPYSPVVPESISNVEFELTTGDILKGLRLEKGFDGRLVNSETGHDYRWSVRMSSVEGKIAITLTPPLMGTATNHTLEFKVGGSTPQEKTLDFNANIMGTPLTGKLLYKGHGSGQKERAQLKANIKSGADTIVNLSGQLDGSLMAWTRMRLKYTSQIGGSGLVKIQREGEKITVELGVVKLLVWPRAYKIQAFRNNALAWSYHFNKEVDMNPNTYELTLTSEATVNPSSMLHQLLQSSIGSFQQRSSKFKIFIEKNSRNFILPKFRLEFEVDRDGVRVVDVRGNTIASPNSFSASIPSLFGLIGISENPATLTIDHQSSSAQRSLVVETNLAGGMRFDASETPSVITQGRIIEVEATKAGTRMWKYFGVTEKENDEDKLKLKLESDFDLNPQSMLYKLVVGKYRLLTPFAKRHSELEFFWDKKNKNALLNKFYMKAKVEKDSETVADVMISTTTAPYKIYALLPGVLGKLRPGWTQIDIDVSHVPGTSLEMKVNHPGAVFKGFKIAKTGNGNEREIEWNGQSLGKGNYVLTDKMLQTNTLLPSGQGLATTITLEKPLTSFLENGVRVRFEESHTDGQWSRNFISMSFNWKLNKVPDFDLSTPEEGRLEIAISGKNYQWGIFQINRSMKLHSEARKISLDWTGTSNFGSGALASQSPIQTEAILTFDVDQHDLNGILKKVMAGKEYSIQFHPGMAMPTIKMGV